MLDFGAKFGMLRKNTNQNAETKQPKHETIIAESKSLLKEDNSQKNE